MSFKNKSGILQHMVLLATLCLVLPLVQSCGGKDVSVRRILELKVKSGLNL